MRQHDTDSSSNRPLDRVLIAPGFSDNNHVPFVVPVLLLLYPGPGRWTNTAGPT